MKKVAVRNLRLCTKDCICLYVCPSGATDTEDSVIDVNKCNGCGICAEACPSKAISLVPLSYPLQQAKKEAVLKTNRLISLSKAKAEKMAHDLADKCEDDGLYCLLKAIERSSRLMNEDIMRESGYMLPQSDNAKKLIQDIINKKPEGFDLKKAQKLINQELNND